MAQLLETWAPAQARRFDDVTLGLHRMLDIAARRAETRARLYAPSRSGALRRSITGRRVGLTIELTATVPYAQIQEHGGVVTGNPMLAIPMRPDVRAVGRARNDGQLFVVRMRGRAFLAKQVKTRGRRGRLDIRWMLIRSVVIPPHPFMDPALRETIAELPAELQYVLKVVTGGP